MNIFMNQNISKSKRKKIDGTEEVDKKDKIDLKDINYEIATPQNLKWRSIWDLYSHYLWYGWISSKVWNTIVFKPNKILKELYKRKFRRDNQKWFTVAQNFYDNTVSKIDFDYVTPSSLELMTENIKSNILEIQKDFDRDKFWKEKLKWNEAKIKLFKNICNKIDEKCLLAYGMTELMPSADWNFNKEVLNFLLTNWWENFVMNLPAIADNYTSFWLYQFTSLAVYDTWNKQEWASKINLYLPKNNKIPASVTKLQWNDHHKAAYLFAMYNLYTLVNNKDEEIIKALELLINQKDNNDLAQLIAIMHNYPANWKIFLHEWYKLNTDKKYLNKKEGIWVDKYNYDLNNNKKIDLYESFIWKKDTPRNWSHNYWKKTYYNKNSL